eukprot:5480180-Amphidinium_carterae.1
MRPVSDISPKVVSCVLVCGLPHPWTVIERCVGVLCQGVCYVLAGGGGSARTAQNMRVVHSQKYQHCTLPQQSSRASRLLTLENYSPDTKDYSFLFWSN